MSGAVGSGVRDCGISRYHAGEYDTICLPRRAPTKRPIVYAHGAGQDGLVPVTFSYYGQRKLITSLVNAGHPIICCDLGGQYTWGNDLAISRINEAIEYIEEILVVDPSSVTFVAVSMGALNVLNWARQNLEAVSSIVGIEPCNDMVGLYEMFGESIDAAYGGVYVNETEKAQHNPSYYTSLGDLEGIPFLAYYASDDEIVLEATVLSLVESIGSSASAVSVGDLGHSEAAIEAVNFDEIISFIGQY